VQQTDIDLDSGKVDFRLDEVRPIDPKQIVEKGIADTVTVDKMILETRGRLVERDGRWHLRIHGTGQLIPLSDGAPDDLRSIEEDVGIRGELAGWREGEAFTVKKLRRR